MRPAQKTSPVKLHRGGGPIPKGSPAVKQRKLSPAALKSKRLKEKESLDKYAESLPLKKRGRNNNPLSKAAALRERRLRAAALRSKRLKEKKGTPKEPFNPIDKVRGGRPDPLLRAAGGRPDPLLRAGRKRQAKKATRTAKPVGDRRVPTATRKATRTAKPVGDRRVPVSRRIPRTATRTAKPVGDRRVPVSRRIRQR
jgi:hypothetical protein